MTPHPPDALPLTPLTMAILLALAEGDAHGYALMREVERQTEGTLQPGTGSLYAALERLEEDGLIDEAQPVEGRDRRRRYYRITARGRALARAEARRMERVLSLARQRDLAAGPGSPEGGSEGPEVAPAGGEA